MTSSLCECFARISVVLGGYLMTFIVSWWYSSTSPAWRAQLWYLSLAMTYRMRWWWRLIWPRMDVYASCVGAMTSQVDSGSQLNVLEREDRIDVSAAKISIQVRTRLVVLRGKHINLHWY